MKVYLLTTRLRSHFVFIIVPAAPAEAELLLGAAPAAAEVLLPAGSKDLTYPIFPSGAGGSLEPNLNDPTAEKYLRNILKTVPPYSDFRDMRKIFSSAGIMLDCS